MDAGSKSKRIIQKKCDKIELEKDELLEDNHHYAKKAEMSVEEVE